MAVPEFLSLLFLTALAWLVWDSLKAREAAISASRAACRAEGMQFLDDTVAQQSLWPVRDSDGHMKLRRVYAFEYSDTGNNRRKGFATLLGTKVVTLYIEPRLVGEEAG